MMPPVAATEAIRCSQSAVAESSPLSAGASVGRASAPFSVFSTRRVSCSGYRFSPMRRATSVRIASRHPNRGYAMFALDDPELQSVEADIHDEQSVARVLTGAYGVVNAVSLYTEHGTETFHSLHVECAQRLATQACQAGVERLVHVSGIGADAASPSLYVRKRGEGELAVQAAFADALLIRPAVMFGPDDSFITTIITLLERLQSIQCSAAASRDCSRRMWRM
jgi:nucleoside-diphosphate-sugar epimerase